MKFAAWNENAKATRSADKRGEESSKTMSKLTERIQLTCYDRDLILKYGYPFDRLKKNLQRWPASQGIRRISMSEYELSMLIGELCRSINHEQVGSDFDEVVDLCDRLEYAEKTGDGDLDIMI